MKFKLISIFSILVLLSSCSALKKKKESTSDLNYMQNIEQIATDASKKNNNTTIQSGDQLVINVTAKDMDVVMPFNQNYSSGEMVHSNAIAGTNVPNVGTTAVSGPTYIVDSNGDIDFPVIGKVETRGKSLAELKNDLESKISKYVINPTVNVRHTNFRVTVLGEVNRQGDYIISNGQATIFNALGLAGDLTMYGKRNDVLVLRNIDGEITKARVNLLDANFINTPYYNLRQNDVIYVSSNATREKTSKLDPKTGVYISIASVALGLAGIFVTIFKK